jgi:hypothetical protein
MQRKRGQCKTAELLLLLLIAAMLLPALVSLSLSLSVSLGLVASRLSTPLLGCVTSFSMQHPPRSPTSFVSFTHLPSFLTPFLSRAKYDRHRTLETQPGWTRRYASRPKPRSTRFGDCSNLASGTETMLG